MPRERDVHGVWFGVGRCDDRSAGKDDSGLAPAASVRAPAKPAQESGVTTLLVLIALLALVVAVGLRLIAE